MTGAEPMRVLIAGGGVAGLEAALALRDLARDRVELALLDPADAFVFRPMATAEPFARGHAQRIPFDRIASDVGATFFSGALSEVDAERREVRTSAGAVLGYDALLLAVGGRSMPAYQRALTWTPETDAQIFGGLLQDLEQGYSKSVAFVVPPSVSWPLPAYELALMTAWQAKGMGQSDVRVTVVTPEHAPLEAFGPEGSASVRVDLEEAGVTVETDAYVVEDGAGTQRLLIRPAERVLDAERVVALPRAVGPDIPGVAGDELGFIRVDRNGAVAGAEHVWAAGDATIFPIKQGGIAAQQADAAAQAIAHAAGADVEPAPFRPVLRGLLLTGRGAEWMRQDIAGGGGEGTAARHALWWPPTKVAGRYLSPYLQAFEGAPTDAGAQPTGQPVELDLDSRSS